jgi:regulator of RNase E activity RraA
LEKPTSIYKVIREAEAGDILVFAGQGTPCWLIGENFCHDALYQGLAGFIVDGCIRDADEIAEMPFPVFCRGAAIKPWRTHLSIIGINVPVEFAGTLIQHGDIIAGDGDGLAVIPQERAEEVLSQAKEIAVLEKEKEEAIKRRAPLEELLQMSAAKKTVKNP